MGLQERISALEWQLVLSFRRLGDPHCLSSTTKFWRVNLLECMSILPSSKLSVVRCLQDDTISINT